MRALLLALCLLSSQAWAATSYIKQAGAGSADGTSLANACNGVADVDCTKANGDTVYICGAWTTGISLATASTVVYDLNCNGESAATLTVAGIAWTIGAGGTYTLKGGTLTTSSNVCVFVIGADGWTIDGVTFSGCTSTAINFDLTVDADNWTVKNSTFINNKAACITIIDTATGAIDWAGVTIQGNTFTNCNSLGTSGRGAMRFTIANANTTATFTNWSITNNIFVGNSNGQDVVDIDIGVQPTIAALRNQVIDLVVTGNTSTDSGALMSLKGLLRGRVANNTVLRHIGACGLLCIYWSDGTKIEDNIVTDGLPITIDGGGIDIDTGDIRCVVRRNFLARNVGSAGTVNSGYGIMLLGVEANYVYSNVAVGNKYGLFLGDEAGLANPNFIFNNVFAGSVNDGIYMTTTLSTINHSIQNNAVTGNGLYGVNGNGSTDQTMDYNEVYGNASGAYTGQAAGAHDLTAAPLFVGGSSPTTAAGFRLTSNSPLRRVGLDLNIGNIQDCANRAFHHPPSIGACEAASGDQAAPRTARQ